MVHICLPGLWDPSAIPVCLSREHYPLGTVMFHKMATLPGWKGQSSTAVKQSSAVQHQGGLQKQQRPSNLLGWTLVKLYRREMTLHAVLLLIEIGVR